MNNRKDHIMENVEQTVEGPAEATTQDSIIQAMDKAKMGNGTTIDQAVMNIPGNPYEYPGEFVELVADMATRVIAGDYDTIARYAPGFLAHCFHIIEATGYRESLILRNELLGSAMVQLQKQFAEQQESIPKQATQGPGPGAFGPGRIRKKRR